MTVYLIGQPGQSMVKIGYTSADVSFRLRKLRLGSPVELVIRGHWDASITLEEKLHRTFASRRHHGEWFDFSGADPVAEVARIVGRPSLPVPDPIVLKPPPARPKRRRLLPSGAFPPPVGWEMGL